MTIILSLSVGRFLHGTQIFFSGTILSIRRFHSILFYRILEAVDRRQVVFGQSSSAMKNEEFITQLTTAMPAFLFSMESFLTSRMHQLGIPHQAAAHDIAIISTADSVCRYDGAR